MLGQIQYSLLDKSAFTQTGVDFAFKLNSILKVIRSGKWQCPKGVRTTAVATPAIKQKRPAITKEMQVVTIRSEITAAQRRLHSYTDLLTSAFAQKSAYRKATEDNIVEEQLKIAVLKEKLESLKEESEDA